MLIILFVSFRITTQNQQKIIFQNKVIKSTTKGNCVDEKDQTYTESVGHKDDEYFYCNNPFLWNHNKMKFYNCIFNEIEMTKSPTSMIIHTKGIEDLRIQYCTFTNIIYSDKMIHCDASSTQVFIFENNYISNCHSNNNNDARIVFTDNNNNDINNNYVYFNPSETLAQAFYLEYIDGNRFFNNTVVNANCGSGSVIYSKKNDGKGDFQIKDCLFSNCKGLNGVIIYIAILKNTLNIERTIFEHTKNYESENDLIYIKCDGNDRKLSFIECQFRYLECSSRAGGGIGVFLYCNGKPTISYENTIFEHIYHKHGTYGGGAISIDQYWDDKYIEINVKGCTFTNVSDANYGGAIYYNSKENIINIRDSTFINTKSDKDGNSIYIGQTNEYTVTISGSHFIDCGTNPNSYAIYINSKNFDFFDNEIVFSDPLQSCGCIKSNQYYQHNIYRNTFRNARVNFPKNSAGIDESNPSESNKIRLTDNIFDCISGPCEGRCFYIKFSDTNIDITNNSIMNCPSGGILIKIEFEKSIQKLEFNLFHSINNSIDGSSFNEYQICPQIFVKNPISGDLSNEIELVFYDCLFQNNYNPKKGGAIAYGKNKYNAVTKLSFTNCIFNDNKAEDGGSALYLSVYQTCDISNCQFNRNKSEPGSGVIYIETDFDLTGKPSTNPQINIANCNFENNAGKDAGIVISDSQNALVSIQECSFMNCGNSGHVIAIQSNVQSTLIQGCTVFCTDSIYSGGIFIHSNGKIEILFINFVSTSVDSALTIESEELNEKVSVTQCIFDSCVGKSYSCFYISSKTNLFEFRDITVKNTKITGCDNYLGSIKLNGQYHLTITNVSFTNVSCSSLFGGGTGMIFSGISELIFDACHFTDNEAHQDKSMSRPLKNGDDIPYYNGDGGAFQIGCQEETAEMKLKFQNCNFNNNKASRHGGALAIQTIKEFELYNCKLEKNLANYDFESSSGEYLYENYFHKKKEGRGGAIYLNPAAGCIDSFMQNVIIDDCELFRNNAYDGYAIYVEGDDPNTNFTIIRNNFNDNYNPNNYDNDPNIIYGAVITSEIRSITKDTLRPPDNIENFNYFSQSDKNLQINELLYVDHSGKTPTREFTQSDYFPTESFTNSNIFTYSTDFSNSNDFTDSMPFTLSKHFSISNYFTMSYGFSNSDEFSKTGQFSKSESFTKSYLFTESNKFTNSNDFSESKQFSSSRKFTSSDLFSKTNQFSESELFTKSQHFAASDKFTESNDFSESKQFSSSRKFTSSDLFSKTSQFSESELFTKSQHFTKSDKFTESNDFSESKQFSSSSKFTSSDSFSKTNYFSESGLFTKSQHFTESDHFSSSNYFSESNKFSKSIKFTNSDSFSKTNQFLKSELFTKSQHFTESDHFSSSNSFSESNKFTNTNIFSNSDSFSKTGDFSKSDIFSYTKSFSESDLFSQSNIFTLSDKFSNSKQFTKSLQFSQTRDFSSSRLFSNSGYFSESNSFSKSMPFTLSNQFSNSNVFSQTTEFSSSNKFSESQIFTLTNQFSGSNKFTQSNPFVPSDAFSKSNKFSQSHFFSFSDKFSFTSKFSLSKIFSDSNDFSDSKGFSLSMSFSKSGYFSNSDKFTKTELFSNSEKFTKSNSFSNSNEFSSSLGFSKTLKFSESNKFSETNKFSYTSKFSLSLSFTISNKFTKSNAFSQSDNFDPTKDFSNSYEFSETEKFSVSTKFSNSNIFSETQQFTRSSAFSQSSNFDPTKSFSNSYEFSETEKFSVSTKFSNSNIFSETQQFTKSDKFTRSNKFSSSVNFSPSLTYSNSNHFSKSDSFSSSDKFSESIQFSPSFEFSPSVTPEMSNPLCGIWEDGAFTVYNDCDFVIEDTKLVYIYVLTSNFTGFTKEEQNGGAVHLINCGIHCNDTNYIDCISTSGAGGGIYINTTFDMINNATFINVLFLRCKASYGGAVFIYSNSELFNISFDGCKFESNEALKNKMSSNGGGLYGGSAMFLMSKKSYISNSSFIYNKGSGSVKIYNKFDENEKSSLLEKSERTISIHGCQFEEDEYSKGSINYIEEKSGVDVDIIDCKFKGNIKDGSHYINGKLHSKERFHINSCNFEHNLNKSVNIKLINNDLPIIINRKEHYIQYISVIGLCIIIIVIFTFIILKFNIYHTNYNKSQDSFVIIDETYDNTLNYNENNWEA